MRLQCCFRKPVQVNADPDCHSQVLLILVRICRVFDTDTNPEVRAAARQEISRMLKRDLETVWPSLQKALQSNDAGTRKVGLQLLQHLQIRDQRTLKVLSKVLSSDADSTLRLEAAKLLGTFAQLGTRAIPLLTQVAGADVDKRVQVACSESLACLAAYSSKGLMSSGTASSSESELSTEDTITPTSSGLSSTNLDSLVVLADSLDLPCENDLPPTFGGNAVTFADDFFSQDAGDPDKH